MVELHRPTRSWAVTSRRSAFALAILLALLPFLADVALAATRLDWNSTASFPVPLYGLGLVAAPNGKLYAIGGLTPASGGGGGVVNQDWVQEYDPATNIWRANAFMPTARGSLGVATATNGKLYAIGGTGGAHNLVEAYDPATDTWRSWQPISTARQGLAAVGAANGKVYAIGGFVLDFFGMPTGVVGTVEEYDPATNVWTTKTPMPTARGALGLVAAPNGKLYAVGGNDIAVAPLATVEEYDPATDTWTSKRPMLTARYGVGLAAAPNGKLYAVGGIGAGGSLTTVEEYDPAMDVWAARAPIPTNRGFLGLAAAPNGKLYAVGGISSSLRPEVEEYDPITNVWKAVPAPPALPVARHAMTGVVANGKLYVFGGDTGANGTTASNRVDEYDPVVGTWRSAVLTDPLLAVYGAAAALAPNGKIYIAGGRISGTTVNTVLEYTTPTGPSDLGSIRAVASLPGPGRVDLGLAAAPNGRLYAVGGFDNANTVLNRVDEYTPPPAGGANGTWRALTGSGSLPTARVALALARGGDGKLYAIGGQNQAGDSLATVERFSAPADTTQQGSWEGAGSVSQLPFGRWRPTAVGVPDGTIYVLGGKTFTSLDSEVAQYDPASNTWADVAPMRLARYGLAAGLIGDRLFAVGGFPGTAPTGLLEVAAVTRLPTVSAGGPYTVVSGSTVPLNASGSDAEGSALNFAWDLNDDLLYEMPGQNPTFSAAGVAPGVRTVRVRAIDQSGAYGLASAQLTVVAPTCANSRPNVGMNTSKPAPGQLQAVIFAQTSPAAVTNSLTSVRILSIANAAVRLNGNPVDVGSQVSLPAGTQQVTLLLDRQAPGQNPGGASTVAFAVTDTCGEWRSFLGGGPSAF
jgi:N-acetylneuraminic acid mutarotase